MPGGVAGRPRSSGWRDGDGRGEESKAEEEDGEPPGEDEGDIYARSSGLMKDIFVASGPGIRALIRDEEQNITTGIPSTVQRIPHITRPRSC